MFAKVETIRNEEGFHVRPAQLFAEKAGEFLSEIKVVNENGEGADAKSMLELMTLGLEKGSKIRIEASGPDEQAAVEALAKLVEDKFGED